MKISSIYKLFHDLAKEEQSAITEQFEQGGYQKKVKKILLVYRFVAKYHGSFQESLYKMYLEANNINEGTARNYCKRIYAVMIDTVHNFRAQKDYLFIVQKHISQAKMLIDAEFHELAIEELKTAKKLAEQHGFPSACYEIELLLAKLLFYRKDLKDTQNPLQAHHEAAKQAISDFDMSARIHILYQATFDFRLRKKDSDELWQELETAFDALELPKSSSVATLYYYFCAKIKFAHRKENLPEVLTWAEHLYRAYRKRRNCAQEYPLAYLSGFDTYLSALAQMRQAEEMGNVLAELKKLDFTLPILRTKLVSTVIFHEMTLLTIDNNQLGMLTAEQVERLDQKFSDHEAKMLASRSFSTTLVFGIFYVLRFDYARAEEYLSRLPTHRSNLLRPDHQRVILILETLIYMEDERFDFQNRDSKITNLYNRLIDWGGITPCEADIVTFFRNWNSTPRVRRELLPVFKKNREKIIACKQGLLPLSAEIVKQWLTQKINDPHWR